MLYRVLHAVVPALLNALYRPKVEGLEHVPSHGPAILASNHLSALDVIFMPASVPRPVYFVAKSEYFKGPSRHFFENVGVIPVPRRGGQAAEASLRRGEEVLRAGNLLGIYPEGTRSPDGRLYRGKTGPVRLALRTGAPVVPIAMRGTFEIMRPGARLPRIKQVGMVFGEPIDFGRYRGREDGLALRSATDELMYELMMLSGQEYVDEYASAVKATGLPGEAMLDELGQMADDDPFDIPKAS
jgi:1-acyl-sn-glycerol-3-phosphate acyltransferase